MRGNRILRSYRRALSGSIPAGAGESSTPGKSPYRTGVYPRGCGGIFVAPDKWPMAGGLSPRVRGNPQRRKEQGFIAGSIPAGAGESVQQTPPNVARRVYPRGCGGILERIGAIDSAYGLSPRVRGNLYALDHRKPFPGSIPAGAGESTNLGKWTSCARVYPRGCGGIWFHWVPKGAFLGLSPRVRGNRFQASV